MSTTPEQVIDLEAERDFLLQAIEELDVQNVAGTLDDAEYAELRKAHVVRAAHVLRALQAGEAHDPSSAEAAPVARSDRVAASWLSRRSRVLWASGVVLVLCASAVLLNAYTGEREVGESITGSTEQSTPDLLARAQQQTAEGRPVDAVKTYDQVLKLQPDNVQALTYRGWLLRLAGFGTEGLASIDRALGVQPSYPDAHFFKGYILLNDKQDPSGAVTEFKAFFANNPPQAMVPLVEQALKDAEARAAIAK